jgi:hypothetical protein
MKTEILNIIQEFQLNNEGITALITGEFGYIVENTLFLPFCQQQISV